MAFGTGGLAGLMAKFQQGLLKRKQKRLGDTKQMGNVKQSLGSYGGAKGSPQTQGIGTGEATGVRMGQEGMAQSGVMTGRATIGGKTPNPTGKGGIKGGMLGMLTQKLMAGRQNKMKQGALKRANSKNIPLRQKRKVGA